MGKVEIIKSALKLLVQKQIEQGSWGFSDADDDEISWDEVIGWLEQEPCEDCISRESVIEWLKDKDIIKTKNQEENARRELDELPSVTPQPKRGKWIRVNGDNVCTLWKCDQCGCEIYSETEHDRKKFHVWCGMCGARID